MSSSQYEAEQQTKRESHQNAVREIANSRHRAKEAITKAEAQGVPPFSAIVNDDPPNERYLNGERDYRPPAWSKGLRAAHAATLEYWAEVKPYRHNAGDLWTENLITVGFPENAEWREIRRRNVPNIKKRGVEHKDRKVSLDGLGWWRFQQVELGVKVFNRTSREKEEGYRAEKVYLPVVACQLAFEQLNDVLNELGMLAEVRDQEGTSNDPGAPNDALEWDHGDK